MKKLFVIGVVKELCLLKNATICSGSCAVPLQPDLRVPLLPHRQECGQIIFKELQNKFPSQHFFMFCFKPV